MQTDEVFSAVASPIRRRLLELLVAGPRTAGSLAQEFEQSRPAISEHLQILRRAALVSDEVRGRERLYRLSPQPLEQLETWLRPFERYWRDHLSELARHLEENP